MEESKLKQLSGQYPLNAALPEKLPHPTYWPVLMAFSVIFFFWGFITSLIISAVGLIGMGISILGWIGALNNE